MLSFDWNWQDLVVGLISLVLGWLSGIVRPPPGTVKK